MKEETGVSRERVGMWVEELRSGKRRQGKRALRVGDEYCCLGVACEVAIAGGLQVEVTKDKPSCICHADMGATDKYSYDGAEGVLPRSVQQWFGLPALDPLLQAPGFEGPVRASFLNDAGVSFSAIADIIENMFLRDAGAS